jgi:hypothetical protein
MTSSSRLYLVLLLAGTITFPGTLKANPAPMPISGGTVAAKSPHESIRMEAEEVTIRLHKMTYTVEGVYRMTNSGEATTEWVGFPKNRHEMHEGLSYQNFIQFEVWVDGRKVPFAKEGKQWIAGQVTFSSHATTIIRVVYEIKYPETYKWASRDDFAEYIVGTGSLWKGNIGKAIFTVDGSEIGGTKNFDTRLNIPQSHKLRSEQAVRFDAIDFKPERDATLLIEINGYRKATAR